MRRLEKTRRQLLPAEHQTKDLVIPVIVRGESRVPEELRPTLCASLDDVLLSATDVKTKRVVKRVRKVAEAVFERIDAMRHANADFAQDCSQFKFPTTAEIEPWLRTVAPPPLRSPIQAAP
jgi:hypothetical protein